MGIESKAKYFREDTQDKVRQVRILPKDVSFSVLYSLARHQLRTMEEIECVIINSAGERTIISPDYVKKVQALSYEQTMDHILETAIRMRQASAVHMIYKATPTRTNGNS